MSFLTSIPTKILIAIAMISVSWIAGYFSGLNAGRAAQMADTISAYQEREKIDENVSARDDRRICLDLGGLPDQCDELRRLEAPSFDQ